MVVGFLAALAVTVGLSRGNQEGSSGGGRSLGGLRSPAAGRAASEKAGDTFRCTVASVTDGDTLSCTEADENGRHLRVRLSGIAAREADGTCTQGHPCPSASAEAATAVLHRLASSEALTCTQVGTTYGRVAAFCRRSDGIDLSCAMVESETVLIWERYWGRHGC